MKTQINKSELFKAAWAIFNNNGIRTMEAWSEALVKAWESCKFNIELREQKLIFVYEKISNGEERIAEGTTNLELIPL